MAWLHDLWHTFATLQLSAGVDFIQVSKWLGHSTFTLALDTYGDWIPRTGEWRIRFPSQLVLAQPAEAAVLSSRRQSS